MPKKATLESFIIKANIKHNFKYSYDKTVYINGDTKIIIKCPMHGEFQQKPEHHLRGNGCPSCCKTKKLSNTKNIINIICPIHGEFEQTPDNHLAGKGCKNCNKSLGEIAVKNYLELNSIIFIEQKTFGLRIIDLPEH